MHAGSTSSPQREAMQHGHQIKVNTADGNLGDKWWTLRMSTIVDIVNRGANLQPIQGQTQARQCVLCADAHPIFILHMLLILCLCCFASTSSALAGAVKAGQTGQQCSRKSCHLQAHPAGVGPSSRCGTRHHTCRTAGCASCPRPPSIHSTPPTEQTACIATLLHTSIMTIMS